MSRTEGAGPVLATGPSPLLLICHLVDVLPWMSRELAKVLAIALLGYITLFNRPTKRLLVRVLATIKPLDIR